MARPRSAKTRLTLPRYVYRSTSRGKEYWFYQCRKGTANQGQRIPLPAPSTGPEFWAAWEVASGRRSPPAAIPEGTFSALIAEWHASPEWSRYATSTKRNWGKYCTIIEKHWGQAPVAGLEPHNVKKLHREYARTPCQADDILSCLRALIKYGVGEGYRRDNPVREISGFRIKRPYQPWSDKAVDAAKDKLPEHLWWAVGIALYTGQRKGDVLKMAWADVAGNRIAVTQEKTGKRVSIPIHRDLSVILARIPRLCPIILTSTWRRPWHSKAGFDTSWKEARKAIPELKGLVIHGLRHTAVVRLAEAGCTVPEIMSITGHSQATVERYLHGVNRDRLASAAILKLEQHQR